MKKHELTKEYELAMELWDRIRDSLRFGVALELNVMEQALLLDGIELAARRFFIRDGIGSWLRLLKAQLLAHQEWGSPMAVICGENVKKAALAAVRAYIKDERRGGHGKRRG